MKSEPITSEPVMAKVYNMCKDSNQWDQIGTGVFSFQDDLDEESVLFGHSIVVIKHLAGRVPPQDQTHLILKSKLMPEKMYGREQGTIIYWNQIELGTEIAVTFSDKKTCDKQWKTVCSYVGKNPFEVGTLPPPDSVEMPTESNLDKVLASTVEKQEAISYYIINKTQFLIKLVKVGSRLLGGTNREGVFLFYQIVKSIIEYNDWRIVETLFQPDSFPIILETYNRCHNCHVDLNLQLESRFQLVSLIHLEPQIVRKIMISHYCAFFKDVVLASKADLPLQTALEMTIRHVNLDIFNYFISDNKVEELAQMCSTTELQIVIDFVHEQLFFAKQFNDDIKSKLIQKYYSSGLMLAFQKVLVTSSHDLSQKTLVTLIEILSKISSINDKLFTEYLRTGSSILESLCVLFHKGTDNIRGVLSQMLKGLLTNTTDMKSSLDVLTVLFHSESAKIKESSLNNQPWRSQMQHLVELVVTVLKANTEIKMQRLLEVFTKYNMFYLLSQPPLTKFHKLSRLKLIGTLISYASHDITGIHQALIESKLFRTAILWLKQQNGKNNLIQSSIHSILKQIETQKRTSFMEELEAVQGSLPPIAILSEMLRRFSQSRSQPNAELDRHQHILEGEVEERYLIQQNDHQIYRKMSFSEPPEEMEVSLKLMAEQISKKDPAPEEENHKTRRPIKKSAEFSFEFNPINDD